MMEYKIVKSVDNGCGDYLEESVNSFIDNGWIPIGGVVVVNHKNDSPNGWNTMYQAMTRGK